MPVLSDAQIVAAIQAAGFPRDTWAVAVAVALAESSGNSDALNDANSNGSSDYGLFQINSVHAGLLNSHNWRDPADNARMAFAISSGGTNWRPWVAYTSGRYRAYLPRAKRATGSPVGSLPGAGSGAVPAGLPSASDLLDGNTWLRFGYVIVGGVLILIALAQMSGIKTPASMVKGALK